MKTQILHLESFDDRHSILDKLNWGQADRVIMIWPVRGIPLDNKLDLKLIHRRCQASEIKLAIVCKKRAIKDFAEELGIPVFRSLRQAQRIAWEYTLPPYREIQKPERQRTRSEISDLIRKSTSPAWMQTKSIRTIAFSASILSVLVLAAFIIPGARIMYLPKFDKQSLSLTLSASPELQAFNLSGAIPAYYQTIIVEGRNEIEASGQIGIPDKPARGIVLFTNLTAEEITIPQGTNIRTADASSPYRFATVEAATIDADSGATLTVGIECTNPGLAGNLPEGVLVVIEGDLARNLTAVNPEPTSGGTERTSSSPTPDDYTALSEQLRASLWQTALDEAKLSLEVKDVLINSQPSTIVILEEKYTPENSQPSANLSLLLRVEYQLLYIKWQDLKAMGNAILDATLPAGFSAQSETLQLIALSDPEVDEMEQVSWEVAFERKTFTAESLNSAVEHILGRTPEKAAGIIKSEMSLSDQPEIKLFPEWWPILPLLKTRIETIDLLQDS